MLTDLNRVVPGAIYTVQEVASLLRVCPDTVRRWAKAGKITTAQVSRRGPHRITGRELLRVFGEPAMPEMETSEQRKARAKRLREEIRNM